MWRAFVYTAKEGEDRAALACHLHVGADGTLKAHRFTRAVIRVEFRPAPQEELDLLSEPENPGHGVREGENS